MFNYDNNQLKLFKYNILYKDWCVNQLTSLTDQPNIQMIVRNKLYNILKVRIFYPPTINELTNQSIITRGDPVNPPLCYNNPIKGG